LDTVKREADAYRDMMPFAKLPAFNVAELEDGPRTDPEPPGSPLRARSASPGPRISLYRAEKARNAVTWVPDSSTGLENRHSRQQEKSHRL